MREYARAARPASAHHPRAGAHAVAVEPLARPRDAGVRARRAEADRQPAQRDRGDDRDARRALPRIVPRGMREAIARALANEDRELAETRWSDARSSLGPQRALGRRSLGSRLVDSRSVARALARPRVAFAPIERIGGATGWYYGDWLWRLRGVLDLLVGGAGMRRGRRDPVGIRSATRSTSGAWRRFERDRLLRLRRRDEGARARVAAVRGRPDGDGRLVDPADGRLRAGRGRRPRVLVRALADARAHLRRHAPADRRRLGRHLTADPPSAGSGASPWRGPPCYSALIIVSLNRGGARLGHWRDASAANGGAGNRPHRRIPDSLRGRNHGNHALLEADLDELARNGRAPVESADAATASCTPTPSRRSRTRIQLGEITSGRLEDVPHDQLGAPAAGDGVEEVGGRDQHQTSIGTRDSDCLSRSLESLACHRCHTRRSETESLSSRAFLCGSLGLDHPSSEAAPWASAFKTAGEVAGLLDLTPSRV